MPVMPVSAIFPVTGFLNDDVVTTYPQIGGGSGWGGVRRDRYGGQCKGPSCGNKPVHLGLIRHLFSFLASM